jgi:hypothetical protein
MVSSSLSRAVSVELEGGMSVNSEPGTWSRRIGGSSVVFVPESAVGSKLMSSKREGRAGPVPKPKL